MTDDIPLQHPPEFRRLCGEAVEAFRALAAAEPMERGRMIPGLREMLARIDEQVDELDILDPGFAREQGLLVDASSALQSIDLDRGGPHVERYVERAIADIRRVAG
ncbi:MAG: hypothetical protein ACJ8J0_06330 [Longimicrobiaceae bacterium]